MSTRSQIAMRTTNGEILSIYCHHDGYVSYNGEILFTHYDTIEKVSELINLGNLSSLGTNVAACVAYGRDKGETGTGAYCLQTPDELANYARDCDAEYAYLYESDDVWYVKKTGCVEWEKLSHALEREGIDLAPPPKKAEKVTAEQPAKKQGKFAHLPELNAWVNIGQIVYAEHDTKRQQMDVWFSSDEGDSSLIVRNGDIPILIDALNNYNG